MASSQHSGEANEEKQIDAIGHWSALSADRLWKNKKVMIKRFIIYGLDLKCN